MASALESSEGTNYDDELWFKDIQDRRFPRWDVEASMSLKPYITSEPALNFNAHSVTRSKNNTASQLLFVTDRTYFHDEASSSSLDILPT